METPGSLVVVPAGSPGPESVMGLVSTWAGEALEFDAPTTVLPMQHTNMGETPACTVPSQPAPLACGLNLELAGAASTSAGVPGIEAAPVRAVEASTPVHGHSSPPLDDGAVDGSLPSPPAASSCELSTTLVGVASTPVGVPSIEAAPASAGVASTTADVHSSSLGAGDVMLPPPSAASTGLVTALAGADSTLVDVPSIEAVPASPAEAVWPVECVVVRTPVPELATYSRRPKAKAASLSEAVEDYIAGVAKDIPAVLPTPAKSSRRAQNVPVSTPRCSRRVAKLPPEFDRFGQPYTASSANASRGGHSGNIRPQEFDSRAKASVARELGFTLNDQGAGGDKYTKFFGDPLCTRHVAALGARMGKVLPADLPPLAVIVVSP